MSGDIITLRALLDRVSAAKGPDRELDFWLGIRFGREPTRHSDEELQADIDQVGIEGMVIEAPFTSSADAALGLVRRCVTGILDVDFGFEPDKPEVWPACAIRWYPRNRPRDGKAWCAEVGGAPTLPLALCKTALLAAILDIEVTQKDAGRLALNPSKTEETGGSDG